MIWIITRHQGIGFGSSKKLGGPKPQTTRLYTGMVELTGSARSSDESSEVSPSHYEPHTSHIEASKQGGVSKRREAGKMTLPKS